MTTVVELVKRASENISDFHREMAQLSASLERTGAQLKRVGRNLTRGITVPLGKPWHDVATLRYLRRYRSKGIARRRRARGKRA